MNDMVWYACYGSNLLRKRFMCYLKGGLIPGNDKAERGATDPSDPVRDEPVKINHRLFFSLHLPKWGGSGVAFIDTKVSNDRITYGRKYLITREQFLDVVRQENAVAADAEIVIDEEKLKRDGWQDIFSDTWYGRLIYVGDAINIPIYTFTCRKAMEEMELVPAFGGYYQVISDGLKETYHLTDEEIEDYLKTGWNK